MRIGEDARKSVVFFGVTTENKPVEYGGTGFLVTFREPEEWAFTYLVTARHVAQALDQHQDTGFTLRVNTHDDRGSIPIEVTKVVPWRYPEDKSVDVAVTSINLPNWLDQKFFELHEENVVGYKSGGKVVCGGFVSLVGLFRLHAGSKRNVPIVHSGNVAALADPKELVPVRDRITKEIVEREVYLVEAQTLEGLSGSPVFAHEIWDLAGIFPEIHGTLPKAFGSVQLLGLYTGAWDGEPGAILEADRNLRGGKRVPVGMGLVVPAKKIIDLIEGDPMLREARQRFREQPKSATAAEQGNPMKR